jgi:peptidoglycan/LPS O-acetylase OafA/YrhL
MTGNKQAHYTQLNSLRTFAVAMVIIHHWLPDFFLAKLFPLGEMGVILFFVLSGFLITEILIRYKLKAEQKKQPWFNALKVFFIRRSLRIFPVYYVTILFYFFVFNIRELHDNFGYYFFYATNLYFFKIHHWGFGSHLWTLAVEEQFYVIWPLVIFLVPVKKLVHVVLLFILIGIMSKIIWPPLPPLTAILAPHCFESFGLGALFAVVKLTNLPLLKKFKQALFVVSIFLTAFFLYAVFFKIVLNIIYSRLILSILSLSLIIKTVDGFKGLLKQILENKALSYLGMISYSIYLFHNFVPGLLQGFVFRFFGIQLQNLNPSFMNIIYLFVLILVSILSWHVIENPINKYKSKFVY